MSNQLSAVIAQLQAENQELRKALERLVKVRPCNWDDDEGDAELAEAYRQADAALRDSK